MGFQGSEEDYRLHKEYGNKGDAGKISSDESDKYEIDFEETLDNFEHNLLGHKLVNGVWVRDPYKIKLINKIGSSLIMQNLRSAVNKNMNFASFDIYEQCQIESWLSQQLSQVIYIQGDEFEIPHPHNKYQDDIMEMVFRFYNVLLSIARSGHMTIYRGEKTKTVISKVETPQPQGAY